MKAEGIRRVTTKDVPRRGGLSSRHRKQIEVRELQEGPLSEKVELSII